MAIRCKTTNEQKSYKIGGDGGMRHQQSNTNRRTWRDVMESASGMDNAETSAHNLVYADSWRKCDRKDVEHASGTHKGGAPDVESWKHNNRNPHAPMETQISKSSVNS